MPLEYPDPSTETNQSRGDLDEQQQLQLLQKESLAKRFQTDDVEKVGMHRMKSQIDKIASTESKLIAQGGMSFDERIGQSREAGVIRSNAMIAHPANRQMLTREKKHSHTESMLKNPAEYSTLVTSSKAQKALDFLEEVG